MERGKAAIILGVLITGVGHMYMGMVKRGVAILIAAFGIGLVSGFLLPFPYSLAAPVAFYIWQLVDLGKRIGRMDVIKQ